jgi:hypothetical protein
MDVETDREKDLTLTFVVNTPLEAKQFNIVLGPGKRLMFAAVAMALEQRFSTDGSQKYWK